MKTWIDKLRSAPIDMLKAEIDRQEIHIQIAQHDLATMKSVLTERMSKAEKPDEKD